MFGWLRKKTPIDPPTKKQLHYAAKLGLTIRPDMDKQFVSDLIRDAKYSNPKAASQRVRINEARRLKKHGPELIGAEAKWNQFADTVEFSLMVYRQSDETVVDVLRVNEADINGRGELVLGVDAPKLIKDRDIGDCLYWDRSFTLPVSKILHHEPLHNAFDTDGIDVYRTTVKRGLKVARRLRT